VLKTQGFFKFLENSVRWLGFIEGIPVIGLQSIESILPGTKDLFHVFRMYFIFQDILMVLVRLIITVISIV
jgi:hypothetical protein